MKNKEILYRREQIMNIIRSTGRLSTEDAARIFQVSTETIRQDFLYLSQQGVIKKVYGGAVICESDQIDALSVREGVNLAVKDRIAKKAMEYLPEGDCIIGMDSGSTVALLGAYASYRRDLLVVTNSHRILQIMTAGSNRLISLGGEFSQEEMAYYGERPQMLEQITLDVFFLGTSGVKGRNGICTKNFQQSALKNRLMDQSRRKIVLADSSKFHTSSLVEVAPWSKLDLLITDEEIPESAKEQLEQVIQVVIAI